MKIYDEAAGPAAGGAAEPAERLGAWGEFGPGDRMTARQAASVLREGMVLFDREHVVRSALRGDTVCWREERDGWVTVHWVTATEYAPGLIRLRSDLLTSIPKEVWPFALPNRRTFELTFHWSEITTELGEPVFAFCASLAHEKVQLDWPLFRGEAKSEQSLSAASGRLPLF